jgi:hypothetical protein
MGYGVGYDLKGLKNVAEQRYLAERGAAYVDLTISQGTPPPPSERCIELAHDFALKIAPKMASIFTRNLCMKIASKIASLFARNFAHRDCAVCFAQRFRSAVQCVQ